MSWFSLIWPCLVLTLAALTVKPTWVWTSQVFQQFARSIANVFVIAWQLLPCADGTKEDLEQAVFFLNFKGIWISIQVLWYFQEDKLKWGKERVRSIVKQTSGFQYLPSNTDVNWPFWHMTEFITVCCRQLILQITSARAASPTFVSSSLEYSESFNWLPTYRFIFFFSRSVVATDIMFPFSSSCQQKLLPVFNHC